MARKPPPLSREEFILAMRRALGRHIRLLRERGDITQSELSEAIGITSRQFLSLIEGGHMAVPTERVADLAEALSVAPRELALEVMRRQEPWLYDLIFGDDPEIHAAIASLPRRKGQRRGAVRTLVEDAEA